VPALPVLRGEAIAEGATQFKCCPPIREAENRERLWQALAGGDIDCVVSDHSPCTPELKRLDVGDFGLAWGGISSLQIGLSAVWTARGPEVTPSTTSSAGWPSSRRGWPG
jgi:allantoinase